MTASDRWVLDASALLAALHGEQGGETVRPMLGRSLVSAVNWCETLHRLMHRGMPADEAEDVLRMLVDEPVPFDASLAATAAGIHARTRDRGLSLGDCACLALGVTRRLPVVTADRNWVHLDLDIEVMVIRNT